MDRRWFLIALGGLAATPVLGIATAEATPMPPAANSVDAVRAALTGEPVEMQRGRGGGGRGGRGGGGGRGGRGGGGGFRGGGGGFRGGGFGGGGGFRRRRGWGGPGWGFGPRRRCWINRWGERVCRPLVF
jgi:hypothetical protein